MKKIGQGWQYAVYDLGNGRVFKRFNTPLRAYCAMLRDCFPYRRNRLTRFPAYWRSARDLARESMETVSRLSSDLRDFGNPIIAGNGLDYEQDKVEPLSAYFARVGAHEGLVTIDAFAAFNSRLLARGLMERHLHIGKNYGRTAAGAVVLIDLGEIFVAPDRIRRQRERRAWAMPYVVNELPEVLRGYFVEKMDTTFGV